MSRHKRVSSGAQPPAADGPLAIATCIVDISNAISSAIVGAGTG
jgi:hypothetical protein